MRFVAGTASLLLSVDSGMMGHLQLYRLCRHGQHVWLTAASTRKWRVNTPTPVARKPRQKMEVE